MRRITAHYIYTGEGEILKNGIVEVSDQGIILNLTDTGGQLRESAKLEFHQGVIVPGFVNAHCHLELSHMRGRIASGGGLPEFLNRLSAIRNNDYPDLQDAIRNADREMQQNGIVAVGDISNTSDSFACKSTSRLAYHTFIELFGSRPEDAEYHVERGNFLCWAYNKQMQQTGKESCCSLTPHAPYSVSSRLFEHIAQHSSQAALVSMHNQETASENELFQQRSGALLKSIQGRSIDYSGFAATGKNSLPSVLALLPRNRKTILVHNLYTTTTEIQLAAAHFDQLFWCFCPRSNLYIENRPPEIPRFLNAGQTLILGTDSLASNLNLSILDELKAVHQIFPQLSFADSLKWATFNGAKALSMENRLGSIAKGKLCGLNLITEFNFQKMCVSDESKVIPLV